MKEESFNKRFEYEWHIPFEVTLGESYARFLEGLKQKKIIGNICPKCNGLYVPPRPFCDKCFEVPTAWVETDGIAIVESFTVTYVKFLGLPEPPHVTGILKVGDSVTNLLHRIGGIHYDDPMELQDLKVGTKVRPVWAAKRVGDIDDIAYFEPI